MVAGKRTWLRIINPGDSYLASSDPRAHFGLGTTADIDRIESAGPTAGAVFRAAAAGRVLTVTKGEGRPEPMSQADERGKSTATA